LRQSGVAVFEALRPVAAEVLAAIASAFPSLDAAIQRAGSGLKAFGTEVAEWVRSAGVAIAEFVASSTSGLLRFASVAATTTALVSGLTLGQFGGEAAANTSSLVSQLKSIQQAAENASMTLNQIIPPKPVAATPGGGIGVGGVNANELINQWNREDRYAGLNDRQRSFREFLRSLPAEVDLSGEAMRAALSSLSVHQLRLSNPFESWLGTVRNIRETIVDMQVRGMDARAGFQQIGSSAMTLIQQQLPAVRAPSAVLAGSTQETAAIVNAQRQERQANRDPIRQLQAIQEQALQLQNRQIVVGESIERAVRDGRLRPLGE
jgi:hypothetical protein